MLSTAQLAANTANAQLSTGPRTTEGKAISSQNARTHGLTSRDCIVAPEDQPVFQDLLTSLTAEHKPEGATEHLLFYQLVQASWNLRRIGRLETALAVPSSEPLADPLLDDSLDKTLARLARYRGPVGAHKGNPDRPRGPRRPGGGQGRRPPPGLTHRFDKSNPAKGRPGTTQDHRDRFERPATRPVAPKTASEAPNETLEVPVAA